jgi:hypothetical protein
VPAKADAVALDEVVLRLVLGGRKRNRLGRFGGSGGNSARRGFPYGLLGTLPDYRPKKETLLPTVPSQV